MSRHTTHSNKLLTSRNSLFLQHTAGAELPKDASKRVYVLASPALKETASSALLMLGCVEDELRDAAYPIGNCEVVFGSAPVARAKGKLLRDLEFQKYEGAQRPSTDITFQRFLTGSGNTLRVSLSDFLVLEHEITDLMERVTATPSNKVIVLNRRVKALCKRYLRIFDPADVRAVDALPILLSDERSQEHLALHELLVRAHEAVVTFLYRIETYSTKRRPPEEFRGIAPHHILIQAEHRVLLDGEAPHLNASQRAALYSLALTGVSAFDLKKFVAFYDPTSVTAGGNVNFTNKFNQALAGLQRLLPRVEVENLGIQVRTVHGAEIVSTVPADALLGFLKMRR